MIKRYDLSTKKWRIDTLLTKQSKSNSDFWLSWDSTILAPRYTGNPSTTIHEEHESSFLKELRKKKDEV